MPKGTFIHRLACAVVVAITLSLAGCAAHGPHEETGMVIGGVLGGLLGHQVGGGRGRTAATIVGTIAGVAIGGAVGRSMDDVDRMRMAATLETTRTGVPTYWQNPDTGYHYRMVPTSTWETEIGPCREYSLNAMIGGRSEQVYGTACRQPDGSWRIVE
jgi:surface antigen